MTPRHRQDYHRLTAIATDYARLRASLIRARENLVTHTCAQVAEIERVVEKVDQDTAAVFTLLRELEDDGFES